MMNSDDFSEEELEEYEQQLDEIPVKALLVEQNSLLQAILRELQGAQTDSNEETHTCKHCSKEIPESDLESHAKSHKLPPGVDVMSCYE